jgi:hypothetical protein
MSFLTPLFFLGAAAIAIPIFVHLIQRERKRVIHFPSLMFVQRIPYQSVRRRRIRHWWLLLLRCAAILLIVTAFARPFLRQAALAAVAAGGSREVVVLLDHSASMGYGDQWERARREARRVVGALGAADRATLVLFSRNAEESMRATSDRDRLAAAVDMARVDAGATRYGPALKLAESILARSQARRREVVLISDFQRSGWSGSEDVSYPEGLTVTPIPVTTADAGNVAVPSVTFSRASFSGQERVTVAAGVANKGAVDAADVPVTLEIDGHEIQTQRVSVGANAAALVTFTPFTLDRPSVKGLVRAGSDPLPADNRFYFVASPIAPVSLLVVDNGDRAESLLFLTRALAIGATPAFQVDVVAASRVTPAHLEKRSVVILNNTPFPPAGANNVLRRFAEGGGGLFLVTGERTTWPEGQAELLPGALGAAVDRLPGGATIGFRDYSHPIFEIFKAPRSGDFSAARIFRYRALQPGPSDRVLARFDDGAVAAAERQIGAGRVIVWTSTLDDSWTDLPLKPVYLPVVHQIVRYLARFSPPRTWRTIGQVLDVSDRAPADDRWVTVTPSGRRIDAADGAAATIELDEQGFYEIRAAGGSGAGVQPRAVAVNIDPAESDLTPLDPLELVAAVTGKAGGATPVPPPLTPEQTAADLEQAERSQAIWWYLLLGGLSLLAAETVLANRLSRGERFL